MNEMLRRRPAIARIASVLGTGCLLGCNVQVNDVNHGSQLGYAHSNSAQIKVDSGQHTVTSPSIGNGSIAGVVNDEHGQGIAHTRVQLRNDVSGKTLIETLTSADGRFAFTNLANQRYVLWANNMAYVADQAGPAKSLDSFPAVTVSDGRPVSVELTLRKGAVIAGTVSLNGVRTPGVDVSLLTLQRDIHTDTWDAVAHNRANVTTDDRGQFRLFGLAAGDYIVSTRTRLRDGNRGYATSYFPAGLPTGKPAAIVLGLGEVKTVAIPIAAADLLEVAGVVVEDGGRAVALGSVRLEPYFYRGALRMQPSHIVQIEKDGRFRITDVPRGNYAVIASVRPPIRPGQPSVPQRIGVEFLDLESDREDISIHAKNGWAARGRVVGPQRCMPRGEQLTVSMAPADRDSKIAGVAQYARAIEGLFQFADLFGRQRLSIAVDNRAPWYVKKVLHGHRIITEADITAKASEVLEDLVIELDCKKRATGTATVGSER